MRAKGGQPGNTNAVTHGGYKGFYQHHYDEDEVRLIFQFCADPTLDDEIIMQRVANNRLLSDMSQVTDHETRIHAFEVLSTGIGRVARLLRDKRALSGEAADGITDAISAALDELSTELGITL